MKLLLDENLPSRLVQSLANFYPQLQHVNRVGLSGVSDSTIWAYAKVNGFAIVSKDSDFWERSVLESAPPKVVWIRLGNCSTADVEMLLRSAHDALQTFMDQDVETCLLLRRP